MGAPLSACVRRVAAAPGLSRSSEGLARQWAQSMQATASKRPCWLPTAQQGVRYFAGAQGRQEGTVKMWNDERGFGFIQPSGGGEDVFVHRTSLGEGVQLSQGMSVSYDPEWDDRKRKDRAANVTVSAGGDAAGFSGGAPPQGEQQHQPRERRDGGRQPAAIPRFAHCNIVSAAGKWEISRQPMDADANSSVVRQRIVIRNDAPKGSAQDLRKEEFQIVGDGSWDKRLFPAGPDREELVVLRPGGPGSRVAADRNKGHGRNWAVEGRGGAAFDVIYDPETQMVSAEQAFSER